MKISYNKNLPMPSFEDFKKEYANHFATDAKLKKAYKESTGLDAPEDKVKVDVKVSVDKKV